MLKSPLSRPHHGGRIPLTVVRSFLGRCVWVAWETGWFVCLFVFFFTFLECRTSWRLHLRVEVSKAYIVAVTAWERRGEIPHITAGFNPRFQPFVTSLFFFSFFLGWAVTWDCHCWVLLFFQLQSWSNLSNSFRIRDVSPAWTSRSGSVRLIQKRKPLSVQVGWSALIRNIGRTCPAGNTFTLIDWQEYRSRGLPNGRNVVLQ